MQLRDLDDLPPTLDTPRAAELLGVSIDHLWKMGREGTAPVVPLRLGRAYRWPTAPLLRAIGLDPERDERPGSAGPSLTDHPAAKLRGSDDDGDTR